MAKFLLDVGYLHKILLFTSLTKFTRYRHVATIPGSSMGKSGYIRLAYASKNLQQIEEGIKSMADAIAQLK